MCWALKNHRKKQQKNKRRGQDMANTHHISQHKGKEMAKKGTGKKKHRTVSYHSALFFNLPFDSPLPVCNLKRKHSKNVSSREGKASMTPTASPRPLPVLQRRPTFPSEYNGPIALYFTDELVIRPHSFTVTTVRELLAPLQSFNSYY